MYKKMCTYLIVLSAVFAIPEYNNTCVKSRDNIPRTSLVERESLICRLGLSAIYQCTMLALKGTLQHIAGVPVQNEALYLYLYGFRNASDALRKNVI